MNELQIFSNPAFGNVRVVMIDGEPWFVARDVAIALGYEEPHKAIARHCKKVNDFNRDVSSRIPSPKIIPEFDVYRLVMRSNLPEAEQFQDWVVEEVLPAIRKRGYYGVNGGITLDEALGRLMRTPLESITHLVKLCAGKDRQIEALEAKVERDKPKVQYADAMTVSSGCCTPRELALRIKKKFPVQIGPNRFLKYLRREGYLYKHGSNYNLPTQKAIAKGIMDVGNATYLKKNGATKKVPIAVITQKGQQFFIAVFADGLLGWG